MSRSAISVLSEYGKRGGAQFSDTALTLFDNLTTPQAFMNHVFKRPVFLRPSFSYLIVSSFADSIGESTVVTRMDSRVKPANDGNRTQHGIAVKR
jgi:hypothetical protein